MTNYNHNDEKLILIKKILTENDYKNNLLIVYEEESDIITYIINIIKAIYCISSADKPCNKCAQCNLVTKLIHPNIKFIIPSINENTYLNNQLMTIFSNYISLNKKHSLNSWGEIIKSKGKQLIITKELIIDAINFINKDTLNTDPKICIIWGPEYLNLISSNSLLKTIEEQREKCIFVLITEDISNVLETIKSRTINIYINTQSDNQNNNSYAQTFIEILRLSYNLNYNKIQSFISSLDKYTRIEILKILNEGTFILNSILGAKSNYKISNIYNDEIKNSILSLSKILEANTTKLIKNEIENTYYSIKRNGNIKINLVTLITVVNKIF